MPPPILALTDIVLALGSTHLLDGASIAVGAGDRLCLVGRNGSGKSTLLKIAAGLAPFDAGVRFLQPGTTVRYLPQEPDLSGHATVRDYIDAGLTQGEDAYRVPALLDALSLTGAEHPAHLSGGQAKRAALIRALAPSPDLLLLDEPTNHLDLPAIEWLEAELASLRSGLVLISHDRRLLERVGRAVVWLDNGQARRMDRNFTHFEAWRDEILEIEEAERHKLGRQIAREEDWMRYGVTARRKRNVRRVAELATLRREHRENRADNRTLNLNAAAAGLSGKLVTVAEGVTKSWPGRTVVRGLDLRVLRHDRLGIVGANGAGKSTLLGLLTGDLQPDEGTVAVGASLQLATLDQQRATLDPTRTLADTLTDGGGDTVQVAGERRHVIGVMKDFLFRPEQARTPVGTLSGGERGRLALACALLRPSNLLVLDEPTNDLDLETLDLLQDLIADYKGTVMLVSHDRDFLDRVATSLLVAEGDGQWTEYEGGWTDMLAQRGASPFAPAEQTAKAAALESRRDPTTSRAKLSFKDAHALKTLPDTIDKLTTRIDKLSRTLADPDLYATAPARFAALTAELDRLTAEREAAEGQWLDIELKREALETGG